jgi:hypothetical protein
MILALYTSRWEEPAERLQRLVQSSLPGDGIEIYRTFHSFSHRLQNPPDLPFVIVLLACEGSELLDFQSIDHLSAGGRLILVLPDQAEETLRAAHRLRPRYLTYADDDFGDLVRVIQKMAETQPGLDALRKGG